MIVALVSVASLTAAALLMVEYLQRQYAVQPLPAPYIETAEPTPRQSYINLPQTDVRRLLSGNCATVGASSELPEQIKNAFATITRDKPFSLADPGTTFNATDVIEPGLPRRRLSCLGDTAKTDGSSNTNTAEIGLSTALMVLRTNHDQSVALVWGKTTEGEGEELEQVRTMLNDASFWDQPYSW